MSVSRRKQRSPLTPDISITAHSGVLRAVYKNLHIPLRRLVTGEMNVLVVRVKEVAAPCTCVYHRFVHHLL